MRMRARVLKTGRPPQRACCNRDVDNRRIPPSICLFSQDHTQTCSTAGEDWHDHGRGKARRKLVRCQQGRPRHFPGHVFLTFGQSNRVSEPIRHRLPILADLSHDIGSRVPHPGISRYSSNRFFLCLLERGRGIFLRRDEEEHYLQTVVAALSLFPPLRLHTLAPSPPRLIFPSTPFPCLFLPPP